jgi:hypothetical protein
MENLQRVASRRKALAAQAKTTAASVGAAFEFDERDFKVTCRLR